MIRADHTAVLAVGIETYAAGSAWEPLSGPAGAAHRFARWAAGRGVRHESITVATTSIAGTSHSATWNDAGGKTISAEAEPIRQYLVDTLEGAPLDLFVLYWGGHGVVTNTDQRLVFAADARPNDPRAFDVDNIIRILRSTRATAFDKSVVIVDACANYIPVQSNALATYSLPYHALSSTKQALAIFSASRGQFAENDNAYSRGDFSSRLQADLDAHQVFPPDWDDTVARIANEYARMRREGRAIQTPSRLAWSSWEGHLTDISDLSGQVTSISVDHDEKVMIVKRLATLAVSCSVFETRESRAGLVRLLPHEIRIRIEEKSKPLSHALSILMSCAGFLGGLAAFAEQIRFLEGDNSAANDLTAAINEAQSSLGQQ